jgi:hypothetical protein
VGIEHQLREAILLRDLGVDGDGTLVAELAAELNVVEGDGIVRRFGPMKLLLASLNVRAMVLPTTRGECLGLTPYL